MRGKRWNADLRKAITTMVNRGMAHDEVAKCTGVSVRTVSRIMWEIKKFGEKAVLEKRARPPDEDSRKIDFWIKVSNLKAGPGLPSAEDANAGNMDEVARQRMIDLCISYGRAVTVEAEPGRYVARLGSDSLFSSFCKLFPEFCVLSDAEKKARSSTDKVSVQFFNKALEHCGGFERQRRKNWRPGELGKEAGTWMFGYRRWIDPDRPDDISRFRSEFRNFLDKCPLMQGMPSELEILKIIREIRFSWLQKAPDIPDLQPRPGRKAAIPGKKRGRPKGSKTMKRRNDSVDKMPLPPGVSNAWSQLPLDTNQVVQQNGFQAGIPEPAVQIHDSIHHLQDQSSTLLSRNPMPEGHGHVSAGFEAGSVQNAGKSQTRGRRFAPDLRRAIVNMCKRGMAHDEVAKCCNVSLRTVSRVLWELRKYGEEKAYDKRQTRPRKTKDGLEQMGDPGLHETLSVDPLGMGSEVDRNQRRIPSRGRPRKMLTRVPSASDSSRPRTQQEMNMRARERSMQQSQMVSGTSGLNNRNSMQQLAAAAQGLPHVDMGWNMQGGSSMPRFGEWSGFTSHSVANQPGGAVGPSNWNSSFSRGAPQQPSQSQWSSSSFSGAGGHFNNVDPGGAVLFSGGQSSSNSMFPQVPGSPWYTRDLRDP